MVFNVVFNLILMTSKRWFNNVHINRKLNKTFGNSAINQYYSLAKYYNTSISQLNQHVSKRMNTTNLVFKWYSIPPRRLASLGGFLLWYTENPDFFIEKAFDKRNSTIAAKTKVKP